MRKQLSGELFAQTIIGWRAMGIRGRPPEDGFVIYLGRLRVKPGMDPEELVAFARRFEVEEDARARRAMLVEAIVGGWEKSVDEMDGGEDVETAELLDGLLGEF